MRKLTVGIFVMLLCVSMALAGGIVTNTNQSAQYIRTLNRNASTCIDAAYFNPAGLTKLEDGIYISLNNQSIIQTREITNTLLGDKTFEGKVAAPLFPSAYLAYKTGSLAFSAGVMPIGGGGSADFAEGLPSFETKVAELADALEEVGVTGYELDMAFEGTSLYMGGQVGVSYKVNDMISIAAGARLVSASNSYTGHLTGIKINPGGGSMIPAPTFFTGAAVEYTNAANAATLLASYYTTIGMPDSAAYWTTVAGAATQSAAEMTAYAAATSDLELEDATKKGTGFTGIVGVNLSPMDGLNVGIRYEMMTKLELETESDVDIEGVIEDGAKENYDMPAMLALGVCYMVTPALKADAGFNYYMNTGVGWDGTTRNVDNLENGFDVGAAFEYTLSEALKASVGCLYSSSGAKKAYQTDLDYSINSTSVGLGVAYRLSDNLELNLGGSNTFYIEGENAAGTEKYLKTALVFAIGVNYSL